MSKAQADSSDTTSQHYDLDDEQVEALISAIEASPIANGGETSELTIQAALYLTGDKPDEREADFAKALIGVKDIADLNNEQVAFARILDDFSVDTQGETAPQVAQTKQRLARILTLLQEAIELKIKSGTEQTGVGEQRQQIRNQLAVSTRREQRGAPLLTSAGTGIVSAPKHNNGILSTESDDVAMQEEAEEAAVDSVSITDTNWFRFAAFAVVSVGLLLAVVGLVYWLKRKNDAESDTTTKQADTLSSLSIDKPQVAVEIGQTAADSLL